MREPGRREASGNEPLRGGSHEFESSGRRSLAQLGVGVVALFSFTFCTAVMLVLKKTIGLRVSMSEELRGLDLSEHGMEAYAGFQIFRTQ